ncbi:hypothetical protein B566_EDAN009140 [Ephemera danica]|nr:hypothetical protein B566_EDAN009140 [Ephemera danica]
MNVRILCLSETVRMSSEGNDLHANCEGTSADLLRMADMLEKNPGLIDRLAVDTNITFCGEMTPLQSAVHRRHVECVQFLIEKSVHIKRPDCLLLVLRNGAKVNYRQLPPEYHTQGNKKMASLMHYSITPAYSSPDCVEKMARIWTILREFGDDFYFEDEEGLTPLQRLRATYMPYNLNEALERILVEIMSQPLSLQSLCRIRIRRCMGVDCHKRLHMLTNIPRDIRAYLNYDKFEQTLDTIQFQK